MNIEINGPNGRPTPEIADNRKTDGQASKDPATGSPRVSGGGADKLSLTSEATQLKALEEQIAELPVVDTQRVTAVQRSLATGSFQINPAQVADKMLRFEAAMGGEG
jgi:negative regulator of flagellin synthesis FlgM